MMNILILAVFFIAHSAFAGLPSEDAEVARLVAEFKEARTPTVEELQLGKHWKCDAVNAIQGHMERYSGSDYRFVEKQGAGGEQLFVELYTLFMLQNHQVDASNASLIYRFHGGLFMGQPYEDPSITRVHTYLRITKDGRLLVEIDSYLYPELSEAMRSKREAMSVPGTVFPELRLMGYEECKVTGEL